MTSPSASVMHGSSQIIDSIRDVRRARRRNLCRWFAQLAAWSVGVMAPVLVLTSFAWVIHEFRSFFLGGGVIVANIVVVAAVALCVDRCDSQSRRHVARWPARALWIIAAQPVVACCLMFTLAVRVRMTLGHWPRPYIDNPGLPFHDHLAIWSMFLIAPASFLLWGLVAAFALAYEIAKATSARSGVVLAASSALLVTVAAMNPYGFFTWIYD